MLMKGTYVSPFQEPLPCIGDIHQARLTTGEVVPVELKEIRKIQWQETGRLEMELLFEHKVEHSETPLGKPKLKLIEGKGHDEE